jgi:AcrR family transcriptional regulator
LLPVVVRQQQEYGTYTRHVKEGGRRGTRAEQNAASARRLLQALIELTAEQGYEATTAAAIGMRAGYSRAMVHARYGTKDALLDELMRTEYEERVVPARDETATGLDLVLAHVDRLAALATDDERFLKSMFVLSFEAVRGSPALAPRITAWMTGLEKGITAALEKGKEDRSVRADLTVSTAARDIVIAGVGIAYAWIVLPGTNLHEELDRWRSRIINDCARTPRTRRRMRP